MTEAPLVFLDTETTGLALTDAWDEGYTIGNRHDGRRDANPYRKEPR